MVVGVCHLDLLIPGGNSLKGKRQVLRGLMERVKGRFNVSISEVGGQDLWQRAQVGICLVGNDKRMINSSLDKVIDYIERMRLVEVIRTDMEFLNFKYDEV